MSPSLAGMRKRVRPIAPLPRDHIQELRNKNDSGNRTPRKRFGELRHSLCDSVILSTASSSPCTQWFRDTGGKNYSRGNPRGRECFGRAGDGAQGGRGHRHHYRDLRAKFTLRRREPRWVKRRGSGRGAGPAGGRRGCPLRIPRTCGRRPGGCGESCGAPPGLGSGPPHRAEGTRRGTRRAPRAPSPLTLV